jgi:FtsZ-binding cell division protein ZapB
METLQIPSVLMKLSFQFSWPASLIGWVIFMFKSIFFLAVGLIGLIIVVLLSLFTWEVFKAIVLAIAHKLEPKPITETRSKIESGLDAMQKHLDKTKNDSFKIQYENSFLRDKVEELEKARKALIEELGGSTAGVEIEFELWQNLTVLIHFLVADRMRLLGIIASLIESENTISDSVGIEKLLRELTQLKEENISITQEFNSARARSERLLRENDRIKIEYNDLDLKIGRLTAKASEKSEEVNALRRINKGLEESAQSLKLQIRQLKQENHRLTQEKDKLSSQSQDYRQNSDVQERWETEKEQYQSELAQITEHNSNLETSLAQAEYQIVLLQSRRDAVSSNHTTTKAYDACECLLPAGKCWGELNQLRRRVSRLVEREVLLELNAADIVEVLDPR